LQRTCWHVLRGRCPAGENVPLQPVIQEGRCKRWWQSTTRSCQKCRCCTSAISIHRVCVCVRRRKALLALSCLTRHNDAAMDAFRAEGALNLLLSVAQDSADPRQRRCGNCSLAHVPCSNPPRLPNFLLPMSSALTPDLSTCCCALNYRPSAI
jgi:hypothetical protein